MSFPTFPFLPILPRDCTRCPITSQSHAFPEGIEFSRGENCIPEVQKLQNLEALRKPTTPAEPAEVRTKRNKKGDSANQRQTGFGQALAIKTELPHHSQSQHASLAGRAAAEACRPWPWPCCVAPTAASSLDPLTTWPANLSL